MNKINSVERFYLKSFNLPRKLDSNQILSKDEWESLLGKSLKDINSLFIEESLIEECSLNYNIEKKYSKKDLECICKSIGVNAIGNKNEIILNLLNSAKNDLFNIDTNDIYYSCSKKGRALIENNTRNGENKDNLDIKDLFSRVPEFLKWAVATSIGGIIGNHSDRAVLDFYTKPESSKHIDQQSKQNNYNLRREKFKKFFNREEGQYEMEYLWWEASIKFKDKLKSQAVELFILKVSKKEIEVFNFINLLNLFDDLVSNVVIDMEYISWTKTTSELYNFIMNLIDCNGLVLNPTNDFGYLDVDAKRENLLFNNRNPNIDENYDLAILEKEKEELIIIFENECSIEESYEEETLKKIRDLLELIVDLMMILFNIKTSLTLLLWTKFFMLKWYEDNFIEKLDFFAQQGLYAISTD